MKPVSLRHRCMDARAPANTPNVIPEIGQGPRLGYPYFSLPALWIPGLGPQGSAPKGSAPRGAAPGMTRPRTQRAEFGPPQSLWVASTGPFKRLWLRYNPDHAFKNWVHLRDQEALASLRACSDLGNARLSHFCHVGRDFPAGQVKLPRFFVVPRATQVAPLFCRPPRPQRGFVCLPRQRQRLTSPSGGRRVAV